MGRWGCCSNRVRYARTFDLGEVEAMPSWLRVVIRDHTGGILWFDELDPRVGETEAHFSLAPGTYTLRARAGGGLRGQHRFTVGSGQETETMVVKVGR